MILSCHSQALHKLQGSCIPKMLGLGTMWSGDAFLAMSLVQPGTKLTDVRLGPSLCTSAKDALARVHAHGLVHGDVRLENMLVCQHKVVPHGGLVPSPVVIVDFGHARCGASPRDLAAEMEGLLRLLHEASERNK